MGDFKKRLHNLTSHYSRDVSIVTKSETSVAGTSDVYEPKWQFYKQSVFSSVFISLFPPESSAKKVSLL
jgi:hypothetical protein